MERRITKHQAKKILTEYLLVKKARKTIERFAILDEIYSQNSHFNIDSLYLKMKEKNHRISRATLYNTIDILIDAKLVVKHRFNSNRNIIYERSLHDYQHDHLVCTKCGHIIEFRDTTRLDAIKKNTRENYNFKPHHHTLYIYGLCEKCQKILT